MASGGSRAWSLLAAGGGKAAAGTTWSLDHKGKGACDVHKIDRSTSCARWDDVQIFSFRRALTSLLRKQGSMQIAHHHHRPTRTYLETMERADR